jgi:hypothetical protein
MASAAWSPALTGALFNTGLVVLLSAGLVVLGHMVALYPGLLALGTLGFLLVHRRHAQRMEIAG